MTDVPIYKLKFLLLLLLSFLVFFSCSDSEPDVNSAAGFVIFDYASEKSYPSVRFAAFAETSSEIQRVSSISVKNLSTGYEWFCDNPVLLNNDRHKWAGYADFVSPRGQLIPQGSYEIVYTDAQSRSVTKTFLLQYKEKFLKTKSEKAVSLFSEEKKINICVYSEKGTLLYYGERKENWLDNKDVFKEIRDSFYYRECYIEADKSVYCLMPPCYKKNEK